MEECNHKHMALKFLIIGLVLVLVRKYTLWDIWIVIGVIMIIKSILIFLHPVKSSRKKKKK